MTDAKVIENLLDACGKLYLMAKISDEAEGVVSAAAAVRGVDREIFDKQGRYLVDPAYDRKWYVRATACVNACMGIEPEAVPLLLEACKTLIGTGIDFGAAEGIAEAAVAKAVGKAHVETVRGKGKLVRDEGAGEEVVRLADLGVDAEAARKAGMIDCIDSAVAALEEVIKVYRGGVPRETMDTQP